MFGSAGEGGYYARADDAAVFVAPTVLRDLVGHLAIDRSRFRIGSASLNDLVAIQGSSRRALDAGAGGADPLRELAARMYALAALHAGAPGRDEGFDAPTLVLDATTRADGGAPVDTRIAVGAPTRVDGIDAYFARVNGVDATFAVPRAAIEPLLAAPSPPTAPPGDP